MFLVNVAVAVTGLVLVANQINASSCSCNCASGGNILGGGGGGGSWASSVGAGNEGTWGIGSALSGISGIVGLENSGSIGMNGNVNTDAPIVVRPQELPKPPVALPVSLSPVAGPCVCKKAIVKPAVLPKPVYHPPMKIIGTCGMGMYGETSMNKYHSTSTMGAGTTVIGSPIILDKNTLYSNNQANLAPADAVSLSLAFQTAQQSNRAPVEDRLAFGFRKIPEEIPRQVIYKKNIPEEQIFNMNGQIVELKPVQLGSQKTLEEEAHEELLDLQEEENEGNSYTGGAGLRRLSLGEIGYGPAKIDKKKFIDVPSASMGEAVEGLSQMASEVGSAAASAVGNLLGGGKKNGFVAGNVVYKTVPKLSQVLTPLPEVPPDQGECQSQEANEHQSVVYDGSPTGVSCGMCCNPCCTSHTFHSSSSSSSSSIGKKASVLVQRLTS